MRSELLGASNVDCKICLTGMLLAEINWTNFINSPTVQQVPTLMYRLNTRHLCYTLETCFLDISGWQRRSCLIVNVGRLTVHIASLLDRVQTGKTDRCLYLRCLTVPMCVFTVGGRRSKTFACLDSLVVMLLKLKCNTFWWRKAMFHGFDVFYHIRNTYSVK